MKSYSHHQIAEAVKAYRVPLGPAELKRTEDIKKFPNDILLSYLIENKRLLLSAQL